MSKIRNLKLIYISLCVLLALTCQLQLKEEDISGGKPSISDLNLLLPICKSSNINDCRDVVYRIKSQNGCFDWELEKNDALRLKKISSKVTEKKECFDSVLVITNTNRNPGNIYLISYDKLSEQRFKTKIGFGFIDKLSIYKRFANMDVGENLELGVTAKDVGNNSFSTVEGYVFNWKIIDNNKNLGELVKLSAENRQLSNYREDAEKIHFSDLVYLHGIKTGIVNIVAELKINGYNIAAPNKEVVIKEDFDLFPKEVFMPYEAQTIFNLFLVVENVKGEEFEKDNNTVLGGFIKKNKKVPVKEENYKNYKFTFNDQTCGNLTHNGKITFTSKTSKCITTLNIVDVRLPEHNNAEAVIHVVDPTSLDLGYLSLTDEDVKSLSNIEDFFGLDFLFNTNNRWILSNNKHYLIKNYLKYEDKQMFYDDKNNKLQFIPKLDSLTENKNIEILKTFYNGKYLLIKTIQPTKDYNKIQSTCLSNKSTKHVKIYDSIKIENFGNEKFYLPYLRNTNQELRLIINGGSGVYKIISSNEDVIYVKGNVLYAKNKGESFISVIDIEIENNKDSIPIEVKDIAFLGQLDEHLEVLVNSTAVLHIGAFHNFNSGLKTFTNCTAISLDHSFGEIDEINKSVIFKDENDSYLKRLYKLSKSTLMNYLDVNDKENDYINLKKNYLSEGYLNYSSFGFCSYKEIKSKFAKFISTNQGYEKSLNYQIPYINGLDPHIQFYENLVQTNPSTKDLIDLKVVKSTKEIYYPKEIILSPHSQLDLVFSKGVRPWNQHSNKKIEFTHDLKFNKIQSGIKKEIQKTDLLRNLSFNYMLSEDSILEIKCNAEFDFDVEVEFFTYNIKSSFLRNPANSKFTFLLSCLQPSHISLIVEEDIERSEIFNVPQIDKIKYTKQINTSLFIRAYAFDKFFRLFTVFSQNDKLNKLKDFKELSFEPHNNIFYIRKKIEVNELTEFPVTYFSYNNLNHSILLNGINSAYLTPTSTTLYINREQNFIFNIIGGSGHFKLELTNDVGHLIYRPNINPRVVEFKPKIVGNVSLKLVDLKFSDKVISTANILVLDIHKIQIFSPSYLMVGNYLDVKVKVYDVTGKSFNQEEIEQMNLKIKENEKMNIYSYINILNHTIIDKIPLFGMKEGVISLSLTNNHGIDSNTVQINIFDKLEIFPPTLLLYPGCEFTIKILGGPENEKSLNRIYNIENEEVASIGNFFPLVKAKKIGNTFVSIKLSYKPDENQLYSTQDEKEFYNSIKDQILTEVKIPVQVAFPERVEIEGANNRKIYVNSSVRFLASLKLGDLSFSYCIGDTDFTWSVDNPHIAKFNVKTQENTKCESSKIENSCSDNSLLESPEKIANNYSIDLANISNQIGAYLVSYNYGIVSVKLDMNINYPSPYEAHRPNFFISKKNVSVEDNVWVDVAEFYDKAPGKSLIYLLPFNVSHSLNLHKKDQVIF